MPGEMLLIGVAAGGSLLLITTAKLKQRRAVGRGKVLTEEEIVRHLSRRWLAVDDRRMLERQLATLRASRPAAAPAPRAPASRPEPASGAVKITRRPGGGFWPVCNVGGVEFEAHWDTGADVCKINHAVARHLGIRNPRSELSDDITLISNGYPSRAAKKKIDWTVEGITIPDVDTVIMHSEGKNASCLIGIPFISRLRGTKTVGNDLYIYPPK